MKQRLGRWLHSVQAQITLWAILPVTLALIGLAFSGVNAHQRAMGEFVARRDRALTQFITSEIANALHHGMLSPDGTNLHGWLRSRFSDLSAVLWVIDRESMYVVAAMPEHEPMVLTDPELIKAVESGAEAAVVTRGSVPPMLNTISPVDGTTWTVVLTEPMTGLDEPILRFSSVAPTVAALAMLTAILVLVSGWRMIVWPLRSLAQATEKIAWGDHSAIEEMKGGVLEIQELQRALHAMVERIEGYEIGIRDYLESVTETQESERARLAREIHDGPMQALIALGQGLEIANRLVARNETEDALILLEELRSSEALIVEDLRRTVSALRPVYLEDLGLQPALEMLVRHAVQRTDIKIGLIVEPGLQRICARAELTAYRIAQEALNNALRHAQPTKIQVKVSGDTQAIYLSVVDDGKGFDVPLSFNVNTRRGHFGLMGMTERARQLGGYLTITSAPGQGTKVEAYLPSCLEGEPCPF